MSLCLESTAGCLYAVHVLKDSLLPKSECKAIFIFYSYKVYNLGGERKFLTDLDMSLCLESTAGCLYVVHVLKDSLLPKSECDWNFDYYNSGMVIGLNCLSLFSSPERKAYG